MVSRTTCMFLLCQTLIAAASCSPADDLPGTNRPAELTTTVSPQPLTVTTDAFRMLGWLEGRWRGDQPNGLPFFEEYRFENDSTIRSFTYADSVTSTPTDSGAIVLRNSVVTTGSEGTRWAVRELSESRVGFEPQVGADNSFVWERVSSDAWTATLRWPGTKNRPAREVVYRMARVSR